MSNNRNEELNNACRLRDFNKVQDLLNQGVDPTIQTRDGDTCLHKLLNSYQPINIQLISLLLEKGVNPNIKGYWDCVAFHQQSHEGNNNNLNIEVVKLLQKYGADIKSKSIWGKTLLHYACRSSSEELVMYLIEQGVDPKVICNYGTTCLHFALTSKKPNFKIINLLLDKYINVNTLYRNQKSYLHYVCSENPTFECVKLLIERGLNPNSKINNGDTCLHTICKFYPDSWNSHALVKFADLNVIEFLLNNGADVTNKNKEGATSLQASATSYSDCDKRTISVSLFLLLKGAPVTDVDLEGRTTMTAKLIKYLQSLNSSDQKNILKEIENKIFSSFHYSDIPKHYHSFTRKERDSIFTFFLVVNRQKTANNLEIPQPIPNMIAKESVGLASIMNIIPYKTLYEIVEQTMNQEIVPHQKKLCF